MKILHLLSDGPDSLAGRIIAAQERAHEVSVIDLSLGTVSYEGLVDEIAACDLVISW